METLLLLIMVTSVSLVIVWMVESFIYKSERLISTFRRHWLLIAAAIIIAIACTPFVFLAVFAQEPAIALTDVLVLFLGALSVAIVFRLILERIEYSTIKKILQADMDEVISEQQAKASTISNIFWVTTEDDLILGQRVDVFSDWEAFLIIDVDDEINQLDSRCFEILKQDIHTLDIHTFTSQPY